MQSGDMEVTAYTAANAQAIAAGKLQSYGPFDLKAVASTPQEEMVGLRANGRLTKYKVSSNVRGGNYVSGRNLIHALASNARIFS